MNKTKIEWTDRTVNPVVGCSHGCSFCYARRLAKRQRQRCKVCYDFVPHPHLERLKQITPRQKPKKIFIDSMWDWCSNGVKDSWRIEILKKMEECSQHTFQILSKRPIRYANTAFSDNVWLGTSISKTEDVYRIHNLHLAVKDNIKFVSIEPIHEEIDFWFSKIDWIIIGAETGNRKGKVIPKTEWVQKLIENARVENIPVFIKDNMDWHEKIQEFPELKNRGENKG